MGMDGHFHRNSYPLKLWGVGNCKCDCSRSEKRRGQVSSSSTQSLFSSIHTFKVRCFVTRTCASMWGRHHSSCFVILRIVSFASRTRSLPLIRGVPRAEVLVGVCGGLLALLWLYSRYWQVFQISSLAPATPPFSHIRNGEWEKESHYISGGRPGGQRQFAFPRRRMHTSKNSPRTSQSNGCIHSPCNQTDNSPAIHPEIEFRRWHTYTALRKSLPRTRGVWLLLTRRKYRNVSPLLGETAPKHQCCHFSTAERQLSTHKYSTGSRLPDRFPPVFDFSTPLLRSPATHLKKSVSGSKFDAADFTSVSTMQFLAHSPKALQNEGEQHKFIGGTSKDDHRNGKGKMASLFDIWQQLEPLSSENKQFLVQHLTEKALSHVMWFYEWQKENAVPLLLRYLLQQEKVIKHIGGTSETDIEAGDLRNDKDNEEDDDYDDGGDDDDDDDDDADDGQHDEGDFSTEDFTFTEVDFYNKDIPSKRTQTNIYVEGFNVRHFDSIQHREDATAVFPASPAAAVDGHSLSHNVGELGYGLHHRENVVKPTDDENISIVGSAQGTYETHDDVEAHFITPDSNIWLPELEIDQEYQFGTLSVLGNALSALVTKDIPNITVTVDRLNRHIGTYLQLYKDAVWSLPLQQIVNATLNGGMFPPLVELQNSSFPDFKRDVKCNPKVQVCQNLGSFLRGVGGLLRRGYHSTYPYNVHLRAEGAANLLHTLVVGQRVTPSFFAFVEQIVTAAVLETVLNATTSLFEVPAGSQVFQLINAILSFIGGVYSLADMPGEEMEQMNLVRSKVRNAFYCRISNGRLPYCNPSTVNPIAVPGIPRELVFDPLTGFVKFLYFTGFGAACVSRGGCFADLFIEGNNFDGFYFLLGVGSTGFPVYQGYRFFQQFLELTRLFFWQGLRPSVVDASQGSWAAITSAPEAYFASTKGQLFPFASLASLTPPNNCSDYPPVPFGDTETNFPLCMNSTNQWVVGRVASLGNCNGFLYSHVCVFPATVVFFPTPSPEFWTPETTTSTAVPPSTGPTTPPGGGVPPGGTGGGGTQPVVPGGKSEEGHFGGGSRAEYLYWEEGDSPFDASYPWERKNLVSGWTARRRRTQQKSDRRLVGAHWSVNSPHTYLARGTKLSLRQAKHEANAASSASTASEDVFLIPAAINQQLLSSKMHERRSGAAAYPKELPEDSSATETTTPVGGNPTPVPKIVLLQGEAARNAVAKKLEGLNGMNGRRFQSSIPVHISQFVDGFSGKVITNIPPFFPVPPDFL